MPGATRSMRTSSAWFARPTDVSIYALAPLSNKTEWLVIVGKVLVSNGTKKAVQPEPFESTLQSAFVTYYAKAITEAPMVVLVIYFPYACAC